MHKRTTTFTPEDRLITMKEVRDIVRLSKSRIYSLMNENLFPHPVKIGRSRVAWIEAEIMGYINQRIGLRDGQKEGNCCSENRNAARSGDFSN